MACVLSASMEISYVWEEPKIDASAWNQVRSRLAAAFAAIADDDFNSDDWDLQLEPNSQVISKRVATWCTPSKHDISSTLSSPSTGHGSVLSELVSVSCSSESCDDDCSVATAICFSDCLTEHCVDDGHNALQSQPFEGLLNKGAAPL
jgi:hypothetical protein